MSSRSLKKRIDKILSSISEDFWNDYAEWFEGLSEKQSAKFWLHCYYFACEEKLLPVIPELERDTEEIFDIAFWDGTGQDLFLEACEKEHTPANRYCSFCNIRVHVKKMLEKDFEQEQQKELEKTRQNLLPNYQW